LTIETINTIKGRDLALHLAQNSARLKNSELEDEDDSNLFVIDSQSSDLHDHPWYNDILYYLNHEKCPEKFNYNQRRKLRLDASKYVIINNHLF